MQTSDNAVSVNDADLPEPANEEERKAGDAAANAAFRDAFGEEPANARANPTNEDLPTEGREHQTGTSAADDRTPGEGGEPRGTKTDKTTEGADVKDPYAGLPQEIRDALADREALRHNYAALQGRLTPAQRKIADLEKEVAELRKKVPAAAAPAVAEPSSTVKAAMDKVRGELPEVAELAAAIREEVMQTTRAAAPAVAAAPAADGGSGSGGEAQADPLAEPIAKLSKAFPDWQKTMVSTDFRLFVAAQGTEHSARINGTSDAGVIEAEITRFNDHQRRAQESADAARTRGQRRIERGVVPRGRGSPTANAQPTELDAFHDGFYGEENPR